MPYILDTPGNAALRTGRHSDPERAYLITAVTQRRDPVFAAFEAACTMGRLLADRATWTGATVDAWVLMPDHFHALVVPESLSLSIAVARAKGRTAFEFNRRSGRQGALWQYGFHDRAVRWNQDIRDMIRYVVNNPVRAGLVDSIGEYPFWDCRWADSLDWLM